LCEIVARLHDADRRIAIPGFYDRVRRWGGAEREFMAANGPSDQQILRDAKAEHGWGERGYSSYERTTIRPSLSVTGVTGGFQGGGVQTVLPSRAPPQPHLPLPPAPDPAGDGPPLPSHTAPPPPPTPP